MFYLFVIDRPSHGITVGASGITFLLALSLSLRGSSDAEDKIECHATYIETWLVQFLVLVTSVGEFHVHVFVREV